MQFISIIESLYLSHQIGPKLPYKTTYEGRNSHIVVVDKDGRENTNSLWQEAVGGWGMSLAGVRDTLLEYTLHDMTGNMQW